MKKFSSPFFRHMCLISVFMLSIPSASFAGDIDPDLDEHQYSYGENAGWLNFDTGPDPGVEVKEETVEGFAWAENIGWINLSPDAPGGVAIDGDGNLSGWAWGENVGWISFSCQNLDYCETALYGVSIDYTTGMFSGMAWSENIGWINFSHDQAAWYGVKTAVPNLKAFLGNNTGAPEAPAYIWDWFADVYNAGDNEAYFSSGQTIFTDEMPSDSILYRNVEVSGLTSISGTGTVACSLGDGDASNVLTCVASGGDLAIGGGNGGFRVMVQATALTAGEKINPATDGVCLVDPDSLVKESDGTDNDCADSVVVSQAPTIYYVEPAGFCGGKTPCFEKIQEPLDIAPAGVSVRIGGGTYGENMQIDGSVAVEVGCPSDFSDTSPGTPTVLIGF